jgi:hypothetical protein
MLDAGRRTPAAINDELRTKNSELAERQTHGMIRAPMKALVLTAPSEFNYDLNFPNPRPGKGEVLVKVQACGICGSDIHGMDGRSGRRQMPIVMGHEAAGEIIGLGEGVTRLEPRRSRDL